VVGTRDVPPGALVPVPAVFGPGQRLLVGFSGGQDSTCLLHALHILRPDLVLRAAAEGLGVALARDRLVARDISAGLLVRPFSGAKVNVSRAYWLVQPPDEEPRPAVQTVAQWMRMQAELPA